MLAVARAAACISPRLKRLMSIRPESIATKVKDPVNRCEIGKIPI